MKASTATAGDWSPTASTTNTRVAAMLYAGATDAVAMTVLEISPRAPDLRPLLRGCSCDSMACSAVAIPHPYCEAPADHGGTGRMRRFWHRGAAASSIPDATVLA